MPSYQKYPTGLKLLFSLGDTEKYLDLDTILKIPKENRRRWGEQSPNQYFGGERFILDTRQEDFVKAFFANEKLRKSTADLYFFILSLGTILQSVKGYQRALHEHKQQIVDLTILFKDKVKNEVFNIYDLIGLSRQTINKWTRDIRYKCSLSYFQECVKSNPNQLPFVEVKTIHEFASNPDFFHWSLISIYHYLMREELIACCKSTFYKYVRRLNVSRPKAKKKRHPTGIRADAINQIWHMDVTKINDQHGNNHALHLIKDNFSRKILAWSLAPSVSSSVIIDILHQAYENAHLDVNYTVNLITDGGSENCNEKVKNFTLVHDIRHFVAQVDIKQSNSMVEAYFKTFKYDYIFKALKQDKDLFTEVDNAILDFNNNRPHDALNGATPYEVYELNSVPPLARYSTRIKQAKEMRKINHQRSTACTSCS